MAIEEEIVPEIEAAWVVAVEIVAEMAEAWVAAVETVPEMAEAWEDGMALSKFYFAMGLAMIQV